MAEHDDRGLDFSRWFEGELVPLEGRPEWFGGRQTQMMARVWLVAQLDQGRRWWERRAPRGEQSVIFRLDLAKAEAEARASGGVVLGYPFAWAGMDVLYVARGSAAEVQAEVFAAGHPAFHTNALELCIANDEIAIYLDVEDVQESEA